MAPHYVSYLLAAFNHQSALRYHTFTNSLLSPWQSLDAAHTRSTSGSQRRGSNPGSANCQLYLKVPVTFLTSIPWVTIKSSRESC